jgi:hypothetical protein
MNFWNLAGTFGTPGFGLQELLMNFPSTFLELLLHFPTTFTELSEFFSSAHSKFNIFHKRSGSARLRQGGGWGEHFAYSRVLPLF